VPALRPAGQRHAREHLVGAPALFLIIGAHVRRRPVTDQRRRRVVLRAALAPGEFSLVTVDDLLEPVPFGTTQVLDQAGDRPA